MARRPGKYGVLRTDLPINATTLVQEETFSGAASGLEKELAQLRYQIRSGDLPGVAIEHAEEQRCILRVTCAGAPSLRLLVSYPTQSSGVLHFQLVTPSAASALAEDLQQSLNNLSARLVRHAHELLESDRTCLSACVWQLLQALRSDSWRRVQGAQASVHDNDNAGHGSNITKSGKSTTAGEYEHAHLEHSLFRMDLGGPQGLDNMPQPPWTSRAMNGHNAVNVGTVTSSDGGVEGRRPCPRFTGACFGGNGMLVRFSSFAPVRNILGKAAVPRTLADLRAARHGDGSKGRSGAEARAQAEGAEDAPLLLAEDTESDTFSWHYELDDEETANSSTLSTTKVTGNIDGGFKTSGNTSRGAPVPRRSKGLTRRQLKHTEQQNSRGGRGSRADTGPGLQLRRPLRLSIVDLSFLLPVQRELAENYVLGPRSGRLAREERKLVQQVSSMKSDDEHDTKLSKLHAICMINRSAARQVYRNDLVQLWSLLATAFREASTPQPPTVDSWLTGPWEEHPCCRVLVESLFDRYEWLGDVQTLATMACVLQQLGHSSRNTDRYFFAYADVLHRWGMFTKRAEVLKFVRGRTSSGNGTSPLVRRRRKRQAQVDKTTLELSPFCWNCMQPCDGAVCPSCAALGLALRCAICEVGVRGMIFVCAKCGHGGHASHMRSWFANNGPMCPTGCGCQCRY